MISKIEKITLDTPTCSHEVTLPVLRWRKAVGQGNANCNLAASYIIEGKPMCRRHAAFTVLDKVIAEQCIYKSKGVK